MRDINVTGMLYVVRTIHIGIQLVNTCICSTQKWLKKCKRLSKVTDNSKLKRKYKSFIPMFMQKGDN